MHVDTAPVQSPDRTRFAAFANIALATFAFLASALVFIIVAGDHIHTVSGDFALHYSFIKDISETWTWPLGDKPWTAGMGPYPPFSHYIAAAVGVLIGSPVVAMHDVALFSVFFCYFILFRKLVASGSLAGTCAIAVASVAFIFLGQYRAVFGYEVFFNFFYTQMVGQALLLGLICLVTNSTLSYVTVIITVCIVYALGWLYPQTALLAALGYLSVEFLSLVRLFVQHRTLRWQPVIRLIVAGLAFPLAVALNPAFQYMVSVATNDGSLNIGIFDRALPAIAVLLVVSCILMAVLIRDQGRWVRSASFFAATGLASGTATLLQYLGLLVFHSGSDYAVKKFAFLDVSLLICIVALIAAWRIAGTSSGIVKSVWGAFLPPLAAVGVIGGLPMSDTVSMASFLKYQAEAVRIVKDSDLPDAIGNVASRNSAMPWYLNYTITLVDLKMVFPRAVAIIGTMFDPSKPWPEAFALLNASRGAVPPDCIRSKGEASPIKLVAVRCLKNEGSLRIGRRIDIGGWGSKPPYLASGWSAYEPGGIWSDADSAKLTLTLPHDRPANLALILDGTAFLVPQHPEQRFTVTVEPNGSPVRVAVTAANQGAPIVVPIPNGSPDDIVVDLKFDAPVSPKALGLNDNDGRRLGLFLRSFSVDRTGN